MGDKTDRGNDVNASDFRPGRAATALRIQPDERLVEVDTPSCAELRDLAGLQVDFNLALRFLERYLLTDDAERSAESSDEALWIAAMTMYGRAFSTGRRHRAKPYLEIFSTPQREAHEYLINARNRFVAHSVNAFDQATVFAILTGDGPETAGIRGVGVQQTNLRTLSTHGATDLAELCRAQLSDIEQRMERARAEVADELRQLGPHYALSLAPLANASIDQTRVRDAR